MFEEKISPSKLAYYDACPLFWQDQTEGKSEAAEEGDRLHEAVETGNLSLLSDDEQKEAAKQCIEYMRHLAPNPKPKGAPVGSMLQFDTVFEEMWLESDIGKRGRADKVILPAADRELAHVLDWKFGKTPVEHAQTNAQGIDYAYRVFLKFPEIKRVQVHFVMPRLRDVTWHEFTREDDFPVLRERILEIHRRRNDPFKLPTPNLEKACAYCDLKAKCPALGQTAVALTKRFNLLPLPESFSPEAPRTPEERGMAQDVADLLIKWGEAVKSQNTQAVLNGAEADGYRVQSRKGNTSVQESLAFAKEVCEKYELSLDEVIDKAGKISFPNTIDLIKQYRPDVDAAEIRAQIERDLGHLIKTAPLITFLARERKGKRKEVKENEVANESTKRKLMSEMQQAQTIGET